MKFIDSAKILWLESRIQGSECQVLKVLPRVGQVSLFITQVREQFSALQSSIWHPRLLRSSVREQAHGNPEQEEGEILGE